MQKNSSKILAIDPGTREMGVAFFDRDTLIYYGVKFVPKLKTPYEKLKEVRKMVLRLIRDFKPRVLAIEKTFFANDRNGSLLNALVDDMKAVGKRKNLKVVLYAPNTVRKRICGDGRAGKKDVAKVVVMKYPELKAYLTQDRVWKERYHQNMFYAVALGMMEIKHEKI